MVVTYSGKGCVKATLGSSVFAFNPPSKKSDLKNVRFGADLVLISLNHDDYNGADQMSYGDKEPFVIDGPGEYEVGGIFIRGIDSEGPDNLRNTIYTLELDGMKLCHLGALASPELDPKVFELIGEVDVLFVPTYNEGVLSESEAHKLATRLNPKAIVPLYFGGSKNDTLKSYLKEAGEDSAKTQDKWTVKAKDIESNEGEIIGLAVS